MRSLYFSRTNMLKIVFVQIRISCEFANVAGNKSFSYDTSFFHIQLKADRRLKKWRDHTDKLNQILSQNSNNFHFFHDVFTMRGNFHLDG
jgi:hypothetical protein